MSERSDVGVRHLTLIPIVYVANAEGAETGAEDDRAIPISFKQRCNYYVF